jgi:hypothetical protein
MITLEIEYCYGCGVSPGEVHEDGCGHAVCKATGQQLIQCGGEFHEFKGTEYGEHEGECGPTVWLGYKHGELLALSLGWCTRWGPPWIDCGPDHPEAMMIDLNKIAIEMVWDAEKQDRVLRT